MCVCVCVCVCVCLCVDVVIDGCCSFQFSTSYKEDLHPAEKTESRDVFTELSFKAYVLWGCFQIAFHPEESD